MRKILFFLFLTGCQLFAQPGALRLNALMDTPVAMSYEAGTLESRLRMYANGGLLATISVGITDRFGIGVSYGGENIIGTGNANLNPQPCVQLRYMFYPEQYLIPAFMIGFNSQGYGKFDEDLNRYYLKSRGLYLVASKNTSFLGGLGLHGGINYSLENDDGDKDMNLFIGAHKHLNQELVVLGEYDTAINDNSDNAIGSGKGYLNLGIRWAFQEQFFVEFLWKDIFENRELTSGSSRQVRLWYKTHF